jgi:peptide/nickel transport system ATP-binding protein
MGKVMEQATTAELLTAPRHPYTRALLCANPRYDAPETGLQPIPPGLIAALRAEIAACDAGVADRGGSDG